MIKIGEGKAMIPLWATKQITCIRVPCNKSKQRLGEICVLRHTVYLPSALLNKSHSIAYVMVSEIHEDFF